MQQNRKRFLIGILGALAVIATVSFFFYWKLRNPLLSGNYKPIFSEIKVDHLSVEGELPRGLEGVYLRNGLNPSYPCADYKADDADGMIHAVRFENGQASYYNRMVETKILLEERAAGKSLQLCGPDQKTRPARASFSIVKHHGHLIAISDGAISYEIDENDLRTIGPYDFQGQWKMVVHPRAKIDPKTGEMMILGRADDPVSHYATVTSDGKVNNPGEVDINRMLSPNDYAITPRFILIFKNSISVKDGKAQYESDRYAQVAILSRQHPKTPVRWFHIEHSYVSWIVNAYEEKDTIILQGLYNQTAEKTGSLREWKFELSTGKTFITNLDEEDEKLTLPNINPNYVGQKNRYAYLAASIGRFKTSGVLKYDFATKQTKFFELPAKNIGGEFKFVADPTRPNDEDAGWLLGFVYKENRWSSYLEIIDAQTMKSVAKVSLPQRVPYGRLGTWVPKGSPHSN